MTGSKIAQRYSRKGLSLHIAKRTAARVGTKSQKSLLILFFPESLEGSLSSNTRYERRRESVAVIILIWHNSNLD